MQITARLHGLPPWWRCWRWWTSCCRITRIYNKILTFTFLLIQSLALHYPTVYSKRNTYRVTITRSRQTAEENWGKQMRENFIFNLLIDFTPLLFLYFFSGVKSISRLNIKFSFLPSNFSVVLSLLRVKKLHVVLDLFCCHPCSPTNRSSTKNTDRFFSYASPLESFFSLASSATLWCVFSWFIAPPRSSHLTSIITTTIIIHHPIILPFQPQKFSFSQILPSVDGSVSIVRMFDNPKVR